MKIRLIYEYSELLGPTFPIFRWDCMLTEEDKKILTLEQVKQELNLCIALQFNGEIIW